MPAHLILTVIKRHHWPLLVVPAGGQRTGCGYDLPVEEDQEAFGSAKDRFVLPIVLIATLGLWASAFVAIPIALQDYQPTEVAAFRQAISAILTVPVFLWWPLRKILGALKKDWRLISLMAFLGIGIYHVALSYGQRTVGAGMASLLVNMGPVITAAVAAALLGEVMGWRRWIGGAVAFAGSALLVVTKSDDFSIDPNALLVLLATASQAIYFVLQRQLTRRYSPILLALLTVWLGAFMLSPFLATIPDAYTNAGLNSSLAVLYLGGVTGILPYFGWAWVLSRMPAGQAAVWLYTVPLFAVGLGWAILGEAPTWPLVLSGAVIMAGVTITNSQGRVRTVAQES